MNIEVVGRIRSSVRGEGPHSLALDGYTKLASQRGGTYYSFQQIHGQDSATHTVYQQSVEPLLDLWIAGFNASVIVTGESESGKSYTLAGESNSRPGIVSNLVDQLFSKIGEGSLRSDGSHRSLPRLEMQMFEIHNELIRDLLVAPSGRPQYLEIDETPTRGAHVKDAKTVTLTGAQETIAQFRQAWSRRTDTRTDFGPARNFASIILHFNLTLSNPDTPLPNRSRFSLVLTPGAEKLAEDASQVRVREGVVLSKGIQAVNALATSLANQPYPDRVVSYRESKLTRLLREEVGGNCKTRVIVCLKPHGDPSVLAAILNFTNQLSRVINYPILNDPLAQQLLTQYRAHIQNLQAQLGVDSANPSHVHDMGTEVRRLQTENLHLRDTNERLHAKLYQLQDQFGNVATSKTDLSAQLLLTEEEKLQVSKTLVEMQIENNKVKEEAEASKFELTNKILELESALLEMEADRDRQRKSAIHAKEKLAELEKDRKELADEYVVLKTNYLNTQRAYQLVQERQRELGLELINLVNAKAAIMRQYERRDMTLQAQEEIDRVKMLVDRLATHKLRPEDFEDEHSLAKTLYSTEKRHQSEIDRVNQSHIDEMKRLERRVTSLQKELSDHRNAARERQKKASELNAQLITLRSHAQVLESQNNRLQHKLKDVNDDFRSRLIKYLQDVAEYVDSGHTKGNKKEVAEMKGYVEAMLADLKRSHKVREEQLSQAAQAQIKLAERTARRHEQLMVAYSDLRAQIIDRKLEDIALGPDEQKLQLSDRELESEQQRLINRLREDLGQAQTELEGMRLRAFDQKGPELTFKPGKEGGMPPDQWSALKKQLREFSVNTQQALEQERAELLSKNAMQEQEILDLQAYIDNHLSRYRDEIVRLQEMAGLQGRAGFVSPAGPPLRQNLRRDKR